MHADVQGRSSSYIVGSCFGQERSNCLDRVRLTRPKHLKVLERAGLISRGRDAQRRPRRLEARPLAEATRWLERYRRFWEGNFRRLDVLLDELKIRQKKRGPTKR